MTKASKVDWLREQREARFKEQQRKPTKGSSTTRSAVPDPFPGHPAHDKPVVAAKDEQIDTSDIPEQTEEDFKRSKTHKLRPKKAIVQKLKKEVDKIIPAPSHPECLRCAEVRRQTRERVKRSRARATKGAKRDE